MLPSKMKPIDNHSHILHAGILDMVASARTNDLGEFSITEHVSQFRELRESVRFGSVHSAGRLFESLKEYDAEFKKADEQAMEMKVNRGLEVDFAPQYEARVGDFVNQEEWDILLCSVHELEDGKNIERTIGQADNPSLAHKLWNDYIRLEHTALESDFVSFNVLAHPVRMARGIPAVPPDLDDLLLGLARTAKRRSKALELNGNDIDYAPTLVRRLAIACSKAGCRVTLGSDAHRPNEVFRNMDHAMSLVDEFKLQASVKILG